MRSTMVTGVTGFLGRHILWRRLRDGKAKDRVYCLIRAANQAEADARLGRLLADPMADLTQPQKARAIAVVGDLSQPGLGIAEKDRERVADGLTDIVHCAASVKFTLDLEQARNINVSGTLRMLDLARMADDAGSLRRFDYVGTAYVAGTRQGLVSEDELILDQPFHNTYERTKAESERMVRDAAESLPVTVFRPSIVVGDSRTGVTQSFNVLYWPLKVFARGLVLCVPADPQGHVDIVPIDYVTDAIEWIAAHETPSGRCYHVAAGEGKSVTVNSLAREAARFFDVRMPPYVSPKTFHAILKPIFKVALWGPYRRVYDVGQQYIPYLAYRAIFDTTNARAALTGSGIAPRSVRGYFHLLMNYCLASEWGKREVAQQELERLVAAME